MLEQVIAAPFALIRRPGLGLIAYFFVLFQGALLLLFGESFGVFRDAALSMRFTPTLDFVGGGMVFLISISIPIYLNAIIAHRLHSRTDTPSIPFGLAGSSLVLGLFLGLLGMAALGFGLFMSGVIGYTEGLVSMMGVLLFFILGLLVFFSFVKFMFTPTFLGKGFPIKEAFAESWKLTTGKFIHSILIVLIFIVVGTVMGSLPALLPIDLSNAWMDLLVSGLFTAIPSGFSAVTLALIAEKDAQSPSPSGARHPHRK
ncbi:MAG: hypothetical protein AABW68_01950 [archaeon]